MIMYVVTTLIFVGILANYILGEVLYKEPKNEIYFKNVKNYNTTHQREIMASPKYVFTISVFLGLLIGAYLLLCSYTGLNAVLKWATVLILVILYLVEITRKISLNEENLECSAFLLMTKKIPINKIDGMFVYSFTKRFLNKRALTTKLVITFGSEKYKFTLSSIDVKAVINMMKENFGITENKMYIAKK